MRVAAKSLGCKVNLAETEALLGTLGGVELVEKDAELVFINTCAVTSTAEAKTRAEIRRARRENPDAFLVVSGCFVSKDPETARALGADLVVPNEEKPRVAELVRAALGEARDPLTTPPPALWGSPERYLLNSRVRAFLKVQDGCNAGCAYCIIPRLRGRERSRPAGDALKEAEALLRRGVREIVLTGVRLGSYDGHPRGLAGLVEDLLALGAYVRLSSIEPEDTDERLIETLARHAPAARPHLHLSLQTGSERLLALMNRRYSLAEYKRIVRLAYEKIPDFALTTDVIAGLPTETEADFEATVAVLEELKPARVHVFTYTPRPGTRAARLSQVPVPVRKERTRRLIALATSLAEERIRPKLGGRTTLLVERVEGGWLRGHTPDYYEARVSGEAEPGETVPFVIEGAEGYTLTGRAFR
ncbi:MAG TPA: MiaB/RimO family radical SAM methylthiotransferase [Oceanithermus sp.]|nr:MiaB/RimO family radical SAM methylthiotransferase [Oceanithermus sp.]